MENSTDSALINLIVAGMLLAFVLATAIILFVFFYQRKVNAERHKLQRVQIEHQKALIHATLQAVEEERRQFAANLHDEIGAHLSIAKMTLSSVHKVPSEDGHSIQSTVGILDETIASVHSISHNLFPPVLAKLGLEKAIESYLRKIPPSAIKIEFRSEPLTKRFDKDTELHAFRIFQESLSNAIKHSNGSVITIQFGPKEGSFYLRVQDNGQGYQDTNRTVGLGLQGMLIRAEMIGFALKITPTPSGVTVLLTPKTHSHV